MKLIKKHYLNFIVLSLFLTAVIIATIYDLNISIALYNKNSTLGYIFKVFAEIPAFILLPFCLHVFSIILFRTDKKYYKVLSILLSVISAFFWLIIFDKFLFSEFIPNTHILLTISISLIINFAALYLMSLINKDILKKLLYFFILAIITIVLTAILTHLIKLLFGRVRFRDLSPNYENYTRWYIINGFNGNKSFVSGHTSAASSIYLLNYLPNYFNKTKKLKHLFLFISITFVILSALSRILVGAHYLSDTLFGALLALTIIYFTNKLMINYKIKHKQKIAKNK